MIWKKALVLLTFTFLIFLAVHPINAYKESINGEKYKILWKTHINSDIVSYPLIDEKNDIYILNNTGVIKLSKDGTILWFTKTLPRPWFGFTVYGDTLYVTAGASPPLPLGTPGPGYLYAITVNNGNIKWRFSFPNNTCGAFSSITATKYIIFLNSDDGYTYAINSNGTLKWRLPTHAWAGTPPLVYKNTVYVSSNKLYAININGTIKWTFSPANADTGYVPAVDSHGNVYLSIDDNFYCVTPEGKMLWKKSMGFYTKPIIYRDTLYIATFSNVSKGENDAYLYAMNLRGNIKWKTNLGNPDDFTMPVAGNNKICISTTHINAGGNDTGDIYAIAMTGKIMWDMHLNCSAWISIGNNKTLDVAAENGTLYSIVDQSPSPEPAEKTNMSSPELYYALGAAVVIVIVGCVSIYYLKGVRKNHK